MTSQRKTGSDRFRYRTPPCVSDAVPRLRTCKVTDTRVTRTNQPDVAFLLSGSTTFSYATQI